MSGPSAILNLKVTVGGILLTVLMLLLLLLLLFLLSLLLRNEILNLRNGYNTIQRNYISGIDKSI